MASEPRFFRGRFRSGKEKKNNMNTDLIFQIRKVTRNPNPNREIEKNQSQNESLPLPRTQHGQRKMLAGGRVLWARAVEDEPAAATVRAQEGRHLLARSTAASSAQGELARRRRGEQGRHRLRLLRPPWADPAAAVAILRRRREKRREGERKMALGFEGLPASSGFDKPKSKVNRPFVING
jgi:hypothetical protein